MRNIVAVSRIEVRLLTATAARLRRILTRPGQRRTMKRTLAMLLGVALLLAIWPQPARTQTAAKPFRFAFLMGTTGPNPQQQAAIMLGAQEAAKKLNAQGGILGHPVTIALFDHQFDPARAVRILQDDVLTQSWDVISPGGGTTTTIPMLPLVTRAKVFSIASTLNADPAKITADNPTFFDVYPSPLDAADAFAHYLQKLRVKKVAMVFTTDSFGVNEDRVYEAAVRKVGGITIASTGFDIGMVDVTPVLLQLQAQKPDRLFIMAFGAAAGHLFNSLDKIGWDIPLIGDPITGLTDLAAIAPPRSYAKLLVQTLKINSWVPPERRSAKLAAFLNAIKQDGGPMTTGLTNYTLGWDMVMLPALAAKKAGSIDQQKMIQAMEHLDLPPRERTYLTYDEYNFSPTNHQVSTPPDEYSFAPYTPLVDGMVGKR
jgi:branched-chain amino acid transport system substrate-binding protein